MRSRGEANDVGGIRHHFCGNGGYGSIYQLKKGSTTFQVVANTIDSSGTYWNEGMTIDAKGTLYLTDRYSGSQHIYRVPYDPVKLAWQFSPKDSNWYPTIASGFNGAGTVGITFFDSTPNKWRQVTSLIRSAIYSNSY